MAPPSQPAPSPPITTIQPPPPIPSIPTTIIQPPPPTPIPSLPTTITPPLPPLPTTSTLPLPPLPTIASPPCPRPTISSTSPVPLPTTAPSTNLSTQHHITTTTATTSPTHHHITTTASATTGGILSAADLSGFPLAATLFIPSNDAISHFPTATLNFDPFIILYHIAPQRLSFSDLRRFKTHTRPPTLLPSKTILITNNSPFNFTINDSPISHPDLYATTVSVHGIKTILDYSAYSGDGLFVPEEDPSMPMPTPPQATAPPFFQAGEIMGRRRSDAACLCTEFPIVLSVVCAALAFKIHRNPLTR
ncbi:uncharacterized protein LOC132269457 [Cornus florida]|uniref:uncharacterized protein LOC132269457 n=1 Tax=Cornus florida TaxID=4283 RepID=UPI00289C62C4|nr:uncharacterized protein LOC132269457 [Cornus florida]